MRLTITQGALSRALSSAGRCVAKHGSLPALGAILLDAQDGLALHATDLDRTLRLEVEANVQQAGRALVPAKLLTEFVGGLPGGDVELTADDAKRITVESGSYKANIHALDPEEFPSTPGLHEPASLALQAASLKAAIGQVRHAVDESSGSRPALTGMLFHADGQTLTLAAADGFRLAVKTLPAPTSKPFTAIVPVMAADEMARLLADGDATLEVGSASAAEISRVVLTIPQASLSCRLIDGAFPRYEQIIPTRLENSLSCATSDLRQALRVASPITRECKLIVRLALDAGGIELAAEATDTGNVRANVTATVAAPAGTLALNAVYLADALAAITAERVEMAWQGPQRPLRVVGVGDDSLVQVVMPIHS